MHEAHAHEMDNSVLLNAISVVVPAYNEKESIRELVNQINSTFGQMPTVIDYEIILVDDGSSDGTWDEVQKLSDVSRSKVLGIRLKRNFGKAIALSAGFDRARYPVILTLDADLQDDPAEIPKLLKKLEDGYDLVSGWKRNRQDPLEKKLPSRVFNWVTRKLTGLDLHDFNSGFKCYNATTAKDIHLYGELHRYIPALAAEQGYRVGEVAVNHNPRKYGKSKYGWKRYVKGMIDLLTVMTITRWLRNPGHLFGGIGLTLVGLGGMVMAYLAAVWLFTDNPIGHRPLLPFATTILLTGVQMIVFGLLAELIVRSQHKSDAKQYIRSVTD